MFIKKIGIDLGTTNTLVFVPKKGVVIFEPTIVAYDLNDNKILAVGKEAKEMLGRTPDDIGAYRPLKDGVIADYKTTKVMLKYFISKALGSFNFFKPTLIISGPAGITSTERRAVINAALEAGAREVYLVREPILAALGAGIPINSASGHMIVNIGGGTSEIAAISLGGIVSWASLRIAGNKFDEAIVNYIRKKYNLAIGDQTAEKIKIEAGAALPQKNKIETEAKGRDLTTGLPRAVVVNSNEIAEALTPHLEEIAESIRSVFLNTPPELAADIIEKGIVIAGGSALLRDLDLYISKVTGVNTFLAEDALYCVAKGTGIVLEHLDIYKRALMSKR
ncbi:MAG TPA: rod shape-determining protein [Candidatus Paceibacterota bacterium]|nr:rod shape-determining protein [Candidatus Paceibacterota bacterium]HOL54204.1 rod shape-determining protein [Candidatus Paceibacterota bacterium]HON22069.1 rod shape-determining protein [Candidatus Paceibacterota bacterium]HPP17229.1 rod shape-determining protein [Candidatus Paceibacterota bacterium]